MTCGIAAVKDFGTTFPSVAAATAAAVAVAGLAMLDTIRSADFSPLNCCG